jgi:hypothetical protein
MTGRVKARRLTALITGLVAVVAIALPASAGASFDRHFSVLAVGTGGHETSYGFAFGADLFNPANPSNQVGHAHARCRVPADKARCKILFHFDGSIGGFGDLLVKGNFGHGDQTFTVADGNGDFSGRIAGKAVDHTLNRNTDLVHFDLTR